MSEQLSSNLYLISQIEERRHTHAFFKVGTGKDLKKRLCHLQLANPQELKIEFTYKVCVEDAVILEKFIHKSFKNDIKHIHGEWFKGEVKSCVEQIENLIKEFNSNPNKYRRLSKKEKWGTRPTIKTL